MYEAGSIVLVRFPFSNLTSSKVRPAVVITSKGDDVVIVGIFSRVPEFTLDSWVRLDEADKGFRRPASRRHL